MGTETVDSSASDRIPRSWRRLGHELTSARSVSDLVDTIDRYGWVPPLFCLMACGLFQGAFEFLTEPFAMSQRYIFAGWELALGINIIYGLAFAAFSWFLYFGVIGSFAGFFSDTTQMETTVFKAGGYLLLILIPVLAIGAVLATTVPPPQTAIATVDSPETLASTHAAVRNSTQMDIFGTLMAGAWVLIGFLLLPIISELYDISSKASVLSVLPVTLIAVTAAIL